MVNDDQLFNVKLYGNVFVKGEEGNGSPSNREWFHNLFPIGEIDHASDIDLFGYKDVFQVVTIISLRE